MRIRFGQVSSSVDFKATASDSASPEPSVEKTPKGARFARPQWKKFAGDRPAASGKAAFPGLTTLFDVMMRPLKTKARKGVALALVGLTLASADALLMNGHSAAYLGARYTLSESMAIGAVARRSVDLRDARKRFIELATQLQASPQRLEELKPAFKELIDELDPLVKAKRAVFAEHQTELAQLEADLGWLKSNIGPLTPSRLKDLRERVAGDRDYLADARAIRDGSWIVFGIGRSQVDLNPEMWTKRVDQTAAAVPGSGADDAARRKSLSALVRAQDGAIDARQRAGVLKHFSKMDIDHLGVEIPWYNRPAWLDWLTLGKSAEADLWRAGNEIDLRAGENLDALEAVVAHGEDLVNGAINAHLKDINPEYVGMRARYDLLKPAHDNLARTLSDAERAKSALTAAEVTITFRNAVQMMEPAATIQVSVTDFDEKGQIRGMHTEIQTNPAHALWQVQSALATAAATAAALVAENRVADVNRDLAVLNSSLAVVGSKQQVGRVDDSIYAYFGGLFRLGVWSYDLSQASSIATQLDGLSGEASAIKARIEPEYRAHDTYVWAQINGERQALRSAGAEEPIAKKDE
jgi:hypothetical protein